MPATDIIIFVNVIIDPNKRAETTKTVNWQYFDSPLLSGLTVPLILLLQMTKSASVTLHITHLRTCHPLGKSYRAGISVIILD